MYEVSKEPEGATPLFCFVATQKNNQKTQKNNQKVLTKIKKECII